jgi:hypothetical protein
MPRLLAHFLPGTRVVTECLIDAVLYDPLFIRKDRLHKMIYILSSVGNAVSFCDEAAWGF